MPMAAGASFSLSAGKKSPVVQITTQKNDHPPGSIYTQLGVKPLINARGTVTIIGATKMLPEVEKAMKAASLEYVQLDELMEKVSERLSVLTGAEAGIITTGATGAMIVACAGIVTGGDPDKLWQLPDLSSMKDEVIIPSYSWTAYESSVKGVGVRMIEVTTVDELKKAINAKTALVLVLSGEQSENGPLSLAEISKIVQPNGIPILVDAAAEGLENPNPHLQQGADLVAYSGGKYLRGPQCSGLLLGKKSLVDAAWVTSAPHHGFGRGYKVGREEIVGMLAAVEMWFKRDHQNEFRVWTNRLLTIQDKLKNIPGLKTTLRQPKGRSNPSPDLWVEWENNKIPLTGFEVENLLWDHTPRIAVSGAGSFLPFPPNLKPNILVNSSQLSEGEEMIIGNALLTIFSSPPPQKNPPLAPGTDLSGNWKVHMKYAAGSDDHTFQLNQSGNRIAGMHTGSFVARKIEGEIHGADIVLRSAYREKGVRLSFEFSGKATASSMNGTVQMGEYGKATWQATRST